MTQEMACCWDTGTVGTGPIVCGRPAKAQANDRLDRFRPNSTGYRLVADAPREG